MDKAAAGAEALKSGNYTEAVLKYTEALEVSPTSPDYYIKRSTAYQRSSPPDNGAALQDAEKGAILARKRAKRELIAQAQLRRAIALFMLERYADAQFAFSLVKKLDEKEKTLGIWEKKVADKLKGLPENDSKREVTIAEMPEENTSETPEASTSKQTSTSSAGLPDQVSTAAATPMREGVQTPADKIKHDWYQNNENVYFTLLVKGVPKDKASIDIHPRSLSISFPMPNGSTYDYSLEPLFTEVIASESTFTVMNTKIEVVLRKQTKGVKWKSLETDEPITTEEDGTAKDTEAIPHAVLNPTSTVQATTPAYPTSAKSGAKNWDKIVDSYTKKPSKKSKSEKKDDDASDSEPENDDAIDDMDDGGDPAGAFFKHLYKNADPDTRRAMVKSYQESNGTALSTNWAEVGKGKVETSPPDGMVARKWGE